MPEGISGTRPALTLQDARTYQSEFGSIAATALREQDMCRIPRLSNRRFEIYRPRTVCAGVAERGIVCCKWAPRGVPEQPAMRPNGRV